MTIELISDPTAAPGVHVAPQEVYSLDLLTFTVVCCQAKRKKSQSVSPFRVLIVEVLGLKLTMQSLVRMMHEVKNRLSLMGDTLRENVPF